MHWNPDCTLAGCGREAIDASGLCKRHRRSMTKVEKLGWWAISGDDLLDLLRQAHAGADPDLLYAEHYANAEIERP